MLGHPKLKLIKERLLKKFFIKIILKHKWIPEDGPYVVVVLQPPYIFMRNWNCPNCLHLHAIWNNIRSLAVKLHNRNGIQIVQTAHIFMQIWTMFVVRRTSSCGIIIAQIAHIFMQFETIFDCWPQSSTIKAAMTKTRLASVANLQRHSERAPPYIFLGQTRRSQIFKATNDDEMSSILSYAGNSHSLSPSMTTIERNAAPKSRS